MKELMNIYRGYIGIIYIYNMFKYNSILKLLNYRIILCLYNLYIITITLNYTIFLFLIKTKQNLL